MENQSLINNKISQSVFKEARRLFMITAGACIMAINIKSFIRAGNLVPGGFNGITLLLQQIGKAFFDVEVPFTLINLLLNAVPVFISFRFIGKKFTLYSCLMIGLSSVLTDILPGYPVTQDTLLVCVFGGIINAFAISLCLKAGATSGGTDFIAIFFSEKFGIDTFNYIFVGNVIVILIAGGLFGWDEALYSIIFQFTSTQMLHMLYKRYQKQTLFIITAKPEEVYQEIKNITNHDATLFKGTGCYRKHECNMLYSVVGSDEIHKVVTKIKEIDGQAFINIMKTEQITGRFYKRPND
ncbi:MAG: YitT family protein [Lachnospiraceae bacterium]|nr:YitT family protein [Lachnospiraceae bacterium]